MDGPSLGALPRRTVSPSRNADVYAGLRGNFGGASSPGPTPYSFTDPSPKAGVGPSYHDPVYSHQLPGGYSLSRPATPTHRPGSALPPPAPVNPLPPATHPPPHGPVVRTFSVLLVGDNNQKWYERDVSCCKASDLCGILSSRLGVPINRVLYQGQTLTDEHLAYVPDELKVELPSGPNTGRTSTGHPRGDGRRRRVTLLVEAEPRRVELEVVSVQDLYAQMGELGMGGELLLKKPRGDNMIALEPLQQLDRLDYEQPVKFSNRRPVEAPRPYSPQPSTPNHNRNLSQSATFQPHIAPAPSQPPSQHPQPQHPPPGFQNNPNNLRDPVDLQLVVVETGHMLIDQLDPPVDDAVIATATARVTQQFKQIHQTDDNGRPPNNTELSYLRNLAEQYLRVNGYLDPVLSKPSSDRGRPVSRPPSQLAHPVAQPPPPPPPPQQPPTPPAGPINPPSRQDASNPSDSMFKTLTFAIAGQFPQPPQYGANLLSIKPPIDTVQGNVVECFISTNEMRPIDIRCTLGYENEHGQIVVINLDEFYINQWVTLGHSSPNSIFLSFQPDVLRPGVRYFLDVTAWDAQDFQKLGNAQAEFTMSTLGDPLSVRRSRSASRARAASLPRVPSASARDAILKPPYGFEEGQFQAAMRQFLDHVILPLYDLSSEPRFSEELFTKAVNDACQEFWSYPPNTPFTEEHKKAISIQVKQRLPQ
eukprot:TRINITY_DN1581_c0_g1_i1.p1 TRINITY_DN1581_c0_g1~~TRINITY_DN1581_c0_g1_i1.p1  ORF type:complete len:703 (+),score=196.37 TRINITY_DN1581_c0_g1_i1:487-2595(+)